MQRELSVTGLGLAAVAHACRELDLPVPASVAPLRAAAAGVSLAPDDLVFHCDLVRLSSGMMAEAPARVDAPPLWSRLAPIASRLTMDLVADSPEGLLIYRGGWPFDLRTTDPRPLVGREVRGQTPYGAGDEVMRDLMESSARELGDGLTLWPWGPGRLPALPRVEPAGVLRGEEPVLEWLARRIGWTFEPG